MSTAAAAVDAAFSDRGPPPRSRFRVFLPCQTRWGDNDVYGHANNVQYYAYMDSAVNRFLLDRGLLSLFPRGEGAAAPPSPHVSLVASTACTYHAPVAFPDALEVGLSVTRLGTSSVTYSIGIFKAGAPLAAAVGRFVHVNVDRATHRPAPLAPAMRAVLEAELLVSQ